MPPRGVADWEENTERRVGILENKVDKLLDPEHGIYPKISRAETRLTRWAIAILTTAVGTLITLLATRSHH